MTDRRYLIISIPGGPRWIKRMGITPDHLKALLKGGIVLMNTGIDPAEYTNADEVKKLEIPIVAEMQAHEWSRPKWPKIAGKLFRDGFAPHVLIYIVDFMDEPLNSDHPAFNYGRCVQFLEEFKDRFPTFNKYLVTHPWPVNREDIPDAIVPDIAGWGVKVLRDNPNQLQALKISGDTFLGYWTDPELAMPAAMLRDQAKWLVAQGAMAGLVQTGEDGFFELVERDGIPGEGMITVKAHAIRKGLGW